MLYNVAIKRYPDGTVQYKVYDRVLERDTQEIQFSARPKDEDNVQRKELDNQKRARVEVYDLCRSNQFFWFFTLTFDNEIDSFDYEQCVNQLKRFTKWLGKCGCKYIFVPEQHKSGRWHFHGLVSKFPVQNRLRLRQSVNSKTGRKIQGVWNIENYKFGFSTCSVIKYPDKVSSYLCKYLTKEMSVPKGHKRYWCSSGLNRPQEVYLELDVDTDYFMYKSDFIKSVNSLYLSYTLYEIRPEKTS